MSFAQRFFQVSRDKKSHPCGGLWQSIHVKLEFRPYGTPQIKDPQGHFASICTIEQGSNTGGVQKHLSLSKN